MAFRTNKTPVLQEKTASGSVASFNTALAMPLKSHKIALTATQSGSGTPSPDNVRNINGYSAINISHSDADTSNPTVYTIQIGSTVYGGEYDAITGVLTVTHIFYKPTSPQLVVSNKSALFNLPAVASGFTLETNSFYCNCLRPSNYSANFDNHIHFPNLTLLAMFFEDDIGSDVSDWESYLSTNPVEVVYQLATPTTIQLPPCPIDTLNGVNNIFADTGDVDLTYNDLDIAKRGSFREVFKLPS